MKKYVLVAVFLMTLAGGVGWLRKAGITEDTTTTGTDPRRPSPIDELLPARRVVMASETVRTRVADKVEAAEKPVKELEGTDWAVVMAIYKDYGAAERRARNVTEGSAFKASVFPEDGQGSKYMVVLESGLTHARALQVRGRAVSGGLPPDTYVTRLSARRP